MRRLLPLLLVLPAAGCAYSESAALPTDLRPLVASAAEPAVLHLAETVLIARCMAEAGFGYPLDRTAVREELTAPPAAPAPIATWPSDDERAAGASPAPAAAPPRRRTDLERYVEALDPVRRQAFTVALRGRPSDEAPVEVALPGDLTVRQSRAGCGSDAQRQLYGDLDAYLRGQVTADNLGPIVVAEVTADPAFAAAHRRWRTCLADRGWPVADQAELTERVTETGRNLSPQARERRERDVTVLTARCNRRAALSATARRLTPAAEQRARTRLAPLLTDLSRRQQAALPLARRLLTGTDR
jgi:hypothetical protein